MFRLKMINKPKLFKLKFNFIFPQIVLANMQEKEITPTKETQIVEPDKNYDGLKKVTVNKIPDEYIIPTGEIQINQNGIYNVKDKVTANVNIPEKQLGTKTITTNGIYNATDDNLDGYSSVDVQTSGVDINDYFKSNSFTNSSSVNKLFSQIVKKVTSPIDCTGMTSLEYGFESSGLAEFPQLLNTQNVTNGNRMFYNCTNMKTIPLFDTSKITTMQYMFYNCNKLTSVPNFNTENVNNMYYMFYGCSNLTSVPNFNTEKVNNMYGMFYGCSNLTSVPNFNTSLVTAMYGMFYNCNKLTSVPNFNTENVENMNLMFQQCYLLENAPSFNTQNVVYIDKCFYNCFALKTAPEYDFSKVIRCKDMYYGCSNLTTIGGLINLGKAYSTSLGANDYYSGIYLSNDKLTHDSLMNVINNLYDIASKGVQPQKLQLGSINLAKLEATEEGRQAIASAQNKGWSIS